MHDWTADAEVHDYRQAANPVRPGLTEPIPVRQWSPLLHQHGPTAVHALDLSAELGCQQPATSPALAAHLLRILPGENLEAHAMATSSLFVVLRGRGVLRQPDPSGDRDLELAWNAGDVIVLPAGPGAWLRANAESGLFWVHDGPLLAHLGVESLSPRFAPTHYPAATLQLELDRLRADPGAGRANRLSLLLGNRHFASSRTVTHTLWAMLGLVPAGAIQPPHRHQSVAIDLILDCDPGCYTLVGRELNGDGSIRDPQRIDWEPGGVFLTPPGYWHSHGNSSAREARLMPIQDAGLHTYLRSLDIRFAGGQVVSD
jgi:gentisate 1,2-dioxygenase